MERLVKVRRLKCLAMEEDQSRETSLETGVMDGGHGCVTQWQQFRQNSSNARFPRYACRSGRIEKPAVFNYL